jgi:hypothetical protein
MDHAEQGCGMKWIQLAQQRAQQRAFVDTRMNLSVPTRRPYKGWKKMKFEKVGFN